MVPTLLLCSFCRSAPTIGLESDRAIVEQLVELACPTCHRVGPLQLSPVPPAQRAGLHDSPDDIGDEQLLGRRVRARDWRI